MVPLYPILDLSYNRPLAQEEFKRCHKLVTDIAHVARDSGSSQDEMHWVSPDGHQVYGEVANVDFVSFDSAFVSRLRLESFIFSGVRLATILGNHPSPDWNDYFSESFRGESGDMPDWCIPAFQEYTRELPQEFICNPPLVMGEVGYKVGPYCVNRDVVSYQERINLLREFGELERLRNLQHPVIVEIGGGYGGLAYFIKQIVPDATYIIVDLPRSLLFSGCYLTVTLSSACPVGVFDGGSFSSPGGVSLVVNRLLDKLSNVKIDLAINTLSFAEMAPKIVAHYAAFLAGHIAPEGALFEQNFDNRHFGSSHFSLPADILGQYFPVRNLARGRALWGKPSLWRLAESSAAR